MRRTIQIGLIISLLAGVAAPAMAQPGQAGTPTAATVSPELAARAREVVSLLQGQGDPRTLFTPDFLAQVPPEQFATINRQLVSSNGAVERLERVEATSPTQGTIIVAFERALLHVAISIEAAPPHRIAGLLVTDSQPRGADSADIVLQELRALPGQVSYAVVRLDGNGPRLVTGHQPDRALAIGSAFKLIILGELSRQVSAGQRRWSDVIPVDRHSGGGGLLQNWPLSSPLTLHSLAALTISRSDNTATDVLLRALGRGNIERMMERMGMASAARNRPFLTTQEMFQLKIDEPQIRDQWPRLDEAGRRRLLRERYEEGRASLDFSRFSNQPTAIDTIEWFASANDLARVMDWLRQHGDETSQSLMAINSGVGPGVAREFSYVGFKGGSEPGVINLTYLVRNNAGAWHVVTASWNNTAAVVDEARFAGLMTRAVRLVR